MSRAMRTPGPRIDVPTLLAMRGRGLTYREIGEAMGVTGMAVSNRMLQHRKATAPVPASLFLVEPPRSMTSRDVGRLVSDLVDQCGGVAALAEAAGLSPSAVSRACTGHLTGPLLAAIGVEWSASRAAYVRTGQPKVNLLAGEYRRLRDEVVRAHEEIESLQARIATITARRAA